MELVYVSMGGSLELMPHNDAHIIGFFTGRNDLVHCWHAGKQVLIEKTK